VLAVHLRPTLGKIGMQSNPERVVIGRNPFRIETQMNRFPRVDRKKRGQPWEEPCKKPTLKGLRIRSTLSGLTSMAHHPQGWLQKTQPTLGFLSQPLRGCLPGPPLSFQSQMYKLQTTPLALNAALRAEDFGTSSPELLLAVRTKIPTVPSVGNNEGWAGGHIRFENSGNECGAGG
ncbi:MAG: hypothetical protein JXA73_02175, partial [Acidobacteria bacterium]|nr:hypothetical protein [Acidobacteriota bacterium]